MTDKPLEDDQANDAAFQRAIENMLKAPPKPHDEKKGRNPKPAPDVE